MSSEVFESREDELRASIDGVNRRHLPQIEKSFGGREASHDLMLSNLLTAYGHTMLFYLLGIN